jgi:hypothetical protein
MNLGFVEKSERRGESKMMTEMKRLVGVIFRRPVCSRMSAKSRAGFFPLALLIIVNLATAFVVYRTLINDSTL